MAFNHGNNNVIPEGLKRKKTPTNSFFLFSLNIYPNKIIYKSEIKRRLNIIRITFFAFINNEPYQI